MSKPNEHVKMLLTNNRPTIESKHPMQLYTIYITMVKHKWKYVLAYK